MTPSRQLRAPRRTLVWLFSFLFYGPSLRATSRTPPCGRRTRSRGSPFLAQVLPRPRCRCLGKSATGTKGTKAAGARLLLCLAEGPLPALSGCSGAWAGLLELTPPPPPPPPACPWPCQLRAEGWALMMQDPAQLGNTLPFWSPALEFHWLKQEALGHWALLPALWFQ